VTPSVAAPGDTNLSDATVYFVYNGPSSDISFAVVILNPTHLLKSTQPCTLYGE